MTEGTRVALCLLGPVVVVLFGLGFLPLLPRSVRASLTTSLAFAYLLGATALGVVGLAGSRLAGLPLRRGLYLPFLVLSVLVFLVITIRSRSRRTRALSQRVLVRTRIASVLVGALLVAVCTVVLLEGCFVPVHDFDGRMTWCMAARYMRAEKTASPSALTEARWFVDHPRYPPLLPLVQVGVQEILDIPETPLDDRYVRPLYAAFLPAYLGLVFYLCRRFANRAVALGALAASALVPVLTFEAHGGPSGAYSDFPLACLYGGAVALALVATRPRELLCAGLLSAGAVLTKNEGMPLVLAVVAVGLLRHVVRRPGKVLSGALLLAPPIFAGVLLSIWRAGIPARFDEGYDLLLKDALKRPDPIKWLTSIASTVPTLVRETFLGEQWGFFFWLISFVILIGVRQLRRHPATLPLVLAALAPLLSGFLAYALHWAPVDLAAVTWYRFLLHAAVPITLLAALAARTPVRRATTS